MAGIEMSRGFHIVDADPETQRLLDTMDATARWPAVVDMRTWSWPFLEVDDGGAVLDVGCGQGDAIIELARDRPGVRYVALDASRAMLSEAARRAEAAGAAVELQPGDATALPFDDGTFDAVRSERTLQWLNDPFAGFAEIVRVTKPGGRVVVLDTDFRTAVMNVPGIDIAAEMLAMRPQSAVGGFLFDHAHATGLTAVEAHVATHVLNEWDAEAGHPPGFMPPDVLGPLLTASGRLSPEEVAAWLDAFAEIGRSGRLFGTLTLVGVTGVKPG